MRICGRRKWEDWKEEEMPAMTKKVEQDWQRITRKLRSVLKKVVGVGGESEERIWLERISKNGVVPKASKKR